ncbi:hypothetical protein [Methanobrevibacter millerae]|uniref:Uncharacterized protein n=1 Tax=Methanobrevibacter millerae TaxID=230361 RepID=A0A1G5VR93_9EURY|nr:hypothetical protein [Methanobrevibacter millerae]SDA48410.1 hypothetical protein SAMN02910315_00811 [Methanobrevibacter millerae]
MKKSRKPTVILNKNKSDGFLNLNSKSELSKVMEILEKLMEGDEDEK